MTATNKVVAGNARGGLLFCTGMDTCEGTRPGKNGGYERKRFRMRKADALRAWSEWKSEGAAKNGRGALRPKEEIRPVEEKGNAMATGEKKAAEEKDAIYALCVVGGAPLYIFRSWDKAAAVHDALTAAAKASGFNARYDVVKVREWLE